jgi:hypothetical protein
VKRRVFDVSGHVAADEVLILNPHANLDVARWRMRKSIVHPPVSRESELAKGLNLILHWQSAPRHTDGTLPVVVCSVSEGKDVEDLGKEDPGQGLKLQVFL